MNNFFEQLKNNGEQIRMTDAEKAHMRASMMQEVGAKPVSAVSTPSPYFSLFAVSALLNLRSAVALLLVLVLASSGTAYAAQGALPGDLLYPVKISVNEQVELALATTQQAKIDTEVRLAERRVSEAQTLDKEGRLDATTTAQIEIEFDKHVSHALALADEVPDETSETPGDEPVEPTTTTLAVEVATNTSTSEDTSTSSEDQATSLVPVSLKVALPVVDTATTASEVSVTVQATATATSTATTTHKMYSAKKTELMISLETKRETMRELRARYQNRGEVKGVESDEGDNDKNKGNSNRGKGSDDQED